jgi:ribosomal protein L23
MVAASYPGRGQGRISESDTEMRINVVAGMITKGAMKHDIKRACKQRFNVSARTVETYISRAKAIIRAEVTSDREQDLAEALAYYRSVMTSQASEAMKMKARRAMDDLQGLMSPKFVIGVQNTVSNTHESADFSFREIVDAMTEEEVRVFIGASKRVSRDQYLQRRLYQLSLLEFGRAAWDQVEPSHEFVDCQHFHLLCRHIQAAVTKNDPVGQISRLLINMPPSTAKSYFSTKILSPWVWTWWPSCKFLYFSYNEPRSLDDAGKARDLIRSDWYQEYFGDIVKIAKGDDTKSLYRTNKGGERQTSQPGGTATGVHPDVIVIDDPIKVDDATASPAKRDEQRKWYFETLSSRGVARGVTHIVVQQRLDIDDLSGHILNHHRRLQLEGKESPWHHICLPMRFDPSMAMIDRGYGGDWRKADGELLA